MASPATPAQSESASATSSQGGDLRRDLEPKVSDYTFIKSLDNLKELRLFVIKEGLSLPDECTRSLGRLNSLSYSPGGRAPTEEEWSQVEANTLALFRVLPDELRRKFTRGEIPGWLPTLPVALIAVAFAALVTASGVLFSPKGILICYFAWLAALGALGAVSFVGMNALSVQEDITFDLSNRTLMELRIVLGALFGLVLTLPLGTGAFSRLLQDLTSLFKGVIPKSEPAQGLILLAPFVLGFSTSLVITVLNRLLEAVQALFGKGDERPAATPSGRMQPRGPASAP